METLPIDILWNVIFNFLSWEEIMNVCQTNSRFTTLWQNESLWQFKFAVNFPQFLSKKSPEISWKQYYRLIIIPKKLPLYYQGDPIANVPFEPHMLEKIISLIEVNIEALTSEVNIVFINHLNANIIVKYPGRKIIIQDTNYDQITKILIITDPEFNKWGSSEDEYIIFQELTSSNKISLYGSNLLGNRYALVDYPEGEFFLLDKRSPETGQRFPRWRRCQSFMYCTGEIYNLLWYLKIPAPTNPLQVEESKNLMMLRCLNVNIDNLPSDQINFYYAWFHSPYNKSDICEEIRKKLLEVGHII